MLQSKVSINELGDDNTCIKVYDTEKKKLIAVYKTYKQTGNKLQINPNSVLGACSRKNKYYCDMVGKDLAFRLSAIKEGDLERIEHCNKKTFLDETES